MAGFRKSIPSYLQRSLLMLIIVLLGISVARFFVSMRDQQERIEVLEVQVAQLLADTTRLQIPPQSVPSRDYSPRGSSYSRPYPRNNYNYSRPRTSTAGYPSQQTTAGQSSQPASPPAPTTSSPAATSDSTAGTQAAQAALFTPQTDERPRKFTAAHQFDLNTIDSLNLIRIPGIAGRTASVILKYRQRYGGFYNPWQLQEFLTWDAAKDYMDEWCTVWFTADASRLRTIHINAATISEMQRHPYISHEQAVEIVRYRTRHKRIASVKELEQLSSFSAEQIQQLLPYLTFD